MTAIFISMVTGCASPTKGEDGTMKTTYYKTAYDGRASITEHHDGTATLVVAAGFSREEVKCKSVTSAKRALSQRCDGFYWEVRE